MRSSGELDPHDVELLADALADRLEARRVEREGWVSADVVADHLAVEREWVYDHAAELGAVRLGEGERGRLRFRLTDVDAALSRLGGGQSPERPNGTAKPKPPRRRRTSLGTTPALLPIRSPVEAGRERHRGTRT